MASAIPWRSKQITGVVVSAKMTKTIKVQIPKQKWNKRIQKFYAEPHNVLVSDSTSTARAGDIVSIRGSIRSTKNVAHVVTAIVAPMGPPLSERPPLPSHPEQMVNFTTKVIERERKRAKEAVHPAAKLRAQERLKQSRVQLYTLKLQSAQAKREARREAVKAQGAEEHQQALARWRARDPEGAILQEQQEQMIAELVAKLETLRHAVPEEMEKQGAQSRAVQAMKAQIEDLRGQVRQREHDRRVESGLKRARIRERVALKRLVTAMSRGASVAPVFRTNSISRIASLLKDLEITEIQDETLQNLIGRHFGIARISTIADQHEMAEHQGEEAKTEESSGLFADAHDSRRATVSPAETRQTGSEQDLVDEKTRKANKDGLFGRWLKW